LEKDPPQDLVIVFKKGKMVIKTKSIDDFITTKKNRGLGNPTKNPEITTSV